MGIKVFLISSKIKAIKIDSLDYFLPWQKITQNNFIILVLGKNADLHLSRSEDELMGACARYAAMRSDILLTTR